MCAEKKDGSGNVLRELAPLGELSDGSHDVSCVCGMFNECHHVIGGINRRTEDDHIMKLGIDLLVYS